MVKWIIVTKRSQLITNADWCYHFDPNILAIKVFHIDTRNIYFRANILGMKFEEYNYCDIDNIEKFERDLKALKIDERMISAAVETLRRVHHEFLIESIIDNL